MEKLKELAKRILKANPKAMLSGSFAMKLQGVDLRREPEDLDIWIPGEVKIIEGMEIYNSSSRYPDEDFIRESYIIDGVQVDFFVPVEYPEVEPKWRYEAGLKVLLPEEIMKFKLEHGFDDYSPIGQAKHLEDLIFIMQNKLKNITNPIDIEF